MSAPLDRYKSPLGSSQDSINDHYEHDVSGRYKLNYLTPWLPVAHVSTRLLRKHDDLDDRSRGLRLNSWLDELRLRYSAPTEFMIRA